MKSKLKNLFKCLEDDVSFSHDSEDNKEATLETVQRIKEKRDDWYEFQRELF